MSSRFVRIDEFLLGKGFYKNIISYKKGTAWVHYEKENEKCKVEIIAGNNNHITLHLYSKTLGTVNHHCVSECEIKWCYLEDLMELLGM